MRWARPAVLTILALEAMGGLVSGVLTVIIGEQITPGYIPWSFAATPLLFGLAAVFATYAYWRRMSMARLLALILNVIVAIGAVVTLLTAPHPSLWLALALGVGGAALVILDTETAAAV
jgi:peptidoglycan/LPS O-acetylase OafA/YrhL